MNGYVKIPGSTNKAPLVKFAQYQGDNRQPAPDFSRYDTPVWLLLLSSHKDPGQDLVVVDIDDRKFLSWAIETFGPTPYWVDTSRGRHLYYKAGNQKVISRNGMVHEKVDVKSWGAYVVAPGSVHASGFVYTANKDFDFNELPVFNNALYESLCRESRESRRAAQVSREALTEKGLIQGNFFKEGTWANWSEVICSDGRPLSQVRGGEHIQCPFHKGAGERTMYVYEGGREAHCFKEGITYYNREAPRFVPWQGPWRNGMWTTPYTESIKLESGRLPALGQYFARGRVVVVQAGRGVGKTYQAVKLAQGEDGTVVAVSPTRSLTRSLSTRFKLVNYQDVPGSETSHITGSVAVCTPSVWRSEAQIGLLVLDEVEQQIRSLAGSHLSDLEARRAWEALIRRIQTAERVLLLDADAGPGTMALLHAAGCVDETVWVREPNEAVRPWVKREHKADLTEDATERLRQGERVAVYCQSRRLAQGLAKAWERRGFSVACITSHTAAQYDLSEFSWTAKYQAIIYTPLLGTGVSIDVPFDRVYALLAQNVGTWDDLRQAVARVRTVKHPEIMFWGPSAKPPEPADCNAGAVLQQWILHRDKTPSNYTFRWTLMDDYTSVRGSMYTAAMATVMAYDVSQGSGWLTTAVEAFSQVQAPISEDKSEDTMELSKLVKEVKREEAEAVVSAAPLAPDELSVLEKHGPNSIMDADRLRREHIIRFYGRDYTEVSEEDQVALVVADDDGRRRQRLLVLRDMYMTPEALQEADERALRRNYSGLRYQSRGLRAKFYRDLISGLGGFGVEISANTCSEALAHVQGNPAVKVPSSGSVSAVGALIRAAGLRWVRTKKGPDRQWRHTVELPDDIPETLSAWGVTEK